MNSCRWTVVIQVLREFVIEWGDSNFLIILPSVVLVVTYSLSAVECMYDVIVAYRSIRSNRSKSVPRSNIERCRLFLETSYISWKYCYYYITWKFVFCYTYQQKYITANLVGGHIKKKKKLIVTPVFRFREVVEHADNLVYRVYQN